MHDPEVVVFEIRRPIPKKWSGSSKRFIGQRWFPPMITVWHHEPGGADSGTICKGMKGSGLSWHNLGWAARHWRHLHFQVIPIQRIRHYFVRCAGCGQRMRRSARFGTSWGGNEVEHQWCSSLRHLRFQLEDFQKYLRGDADQNQRWRVEYWLKNNPIVPDSLEGMI